MQRKLVIHPDIVAMLRSSVEEYGHRPLFGVKEGSGWRWITYGEFARIVDCVRGGLASIGVTKGDRVAVISGNRLEWAACCYATFGRGAIYVPMYEAQLPSEWQYILADCEASVCLVRTKEIAEKLEAMRAELPALRRVIVFEGSGDDSYEALAKAKAVETTPLASEDVATLIYTSGTTGNPKGVMLTHKNLGAEINGINAVVSFDTDARTLAFLPWAHAAGGICELHGVIATGGSMAICESTDKIAQFLGEVKPTALCAVPRIWNKIYDGVQKQMASKPRVVRAIFERGMAARTKQRKGEPLRARERIALALAQRLVFEKILAKFGGRLEFAVSGAAALSKDVGEFIDNLGVVVLEGYGMTETCGVATINTEDARRIGTVGKPIPGVRIEIDTTAPGSENGSGEIVMYGDIIMKGYWGLPAETAAALTPDGGMRSGDLGRIDADGFLHITGRVKELYKLENGKYVAPAPIEERITLSPFIAQAMVHGADRPYNVAIVVPDMAALREWAVANGMPEDEAERLLSDGRTRKLIEGELEKLSAEFKGYERVKNFILVDEEFSPQNDMLTQTLKVKRRNVLVRYGAKLDALYGKS